MKGFKKDGKFRPTGNKQKSPLTISQVREKGRLQMQQGFKVYPNTVVNVQSEELPPEILSRVQNLWNNDPHFRKIRKHVREIDFGVNDPDDPILATWNNRERKFELQEDYSELGAELSTVHEIVGHAFWDWSRKWRREELAEFNKLANSMPPISDYLMVNEEEWKKMNDDNEKYFILLDDSDYVYDNFGGESLFDFAEPNSEAEMNQDIFYDLIDEAREIDEDEGHQSMTRYANEQHSAMTELIYGVGEKEEAVYLDDSELQALTDAWYKLHS